MMNIKRTALIVLSAVASAFAMHAEIKYVEQSFRSTNSADVETQGSELGSKSMTSSLTDYPDDFDGNDKAGLIRVKFKNFANADILDKFTADTGDGHIVKTEYLNNKGDIEFWVYLDSGRDMTVNFRQIDGMGAVSVPGLNVSPASMYTLTIENGENVTVNFQTQPEGGSIILDNAFVGTCEGSDPLAVPGVQYGRHHVKVDVPGLPERTFEIEVSAINTSFNLDVRPLSEVWIETNENGVCLQVDNGDPIPFDGRRLITSIPYGLHTLTVTSTRNGAQNSYPVNVQGEKMDLNLKVVMTKEINLFSFYKNSRVAGASVYIDDSDDPIGTTPLAIMLPYGPHKVRMVYDGMDKTETFRVGTESSNQLELKIPTRKTRWNPYDMGYRHRISGLSLSYLQRSYTISDNMGSRTCNLWGKDAVMHGLEIGIPVDITFAYGVGMHTGLFADAIFGNIPNEKAYHYEEWDLYLPIHLQFQLPLSETCSLTLRGGVGGYLGVDAKMQTGHTEDSYYPSHYYQKYPLHFGEDGMPECFNFALEFGGGFMVQALYVGFQYTKGLTNNKSLLRSNQNLDLLPGVKGEKAKMQQLNFNLALYF